MAKWANIYPRNVSYSISIFKDLSQQNANEVRQKNERSLYLFVRNSPINSIDIVGLNPLQDAIDLLKGADPGASLRCVAIGAVMLIEFRARQNLGGANDKRFHCVTSCLLTRSCGKQLAKVFGDLKEQAPGNGGDPVDSRADQVANAVGRECARSAVHYLFRLTPVGGNRAGCECCCRLKGY